MQSQGYNGLSFRELAKRVGIKSASIHHHFPTKAHLGTELVRRYRQEAREGLKTLHAEQSDTADRLRGYAAGFRTALENGNRMCLCGLLGAEYDELPDRVKEEVQGFIDDNVTWLSDVLTSAGDAAEGAAARAAAIYAAISGAQLTARSMADISVFDSIVDGLAMHGLIPRK